MILVIIACVMIFTSCGDFVVEDDPYVVYHRPYPYYFGGTYYHYNRFSYAPRPPRMYRPVPPRPTPRIQPNPPRFNQSPVRPPMGQGGRVGRGGRR